VQLGGHAVERIAITLQFTNAGRELLGADLRHHEQA
jgi:hypothetical protein